MVLRHKLTSSLEQPVGIGVFAIVIFLSDGVEHVLGAIAARLGTHQGDLGP